MVRVKQEDFDKLSQLDRIEYRQRRDSITENNAPGLFMHMFNFILLAAVFIMIFDLWFAVRVNTYAIDLYSLPPIMGLLGIVLLVCLMIDIALSIRGNQQLKELDEKYFKVDLKKKKK